MTGISLPDPVLRRREPPAVVVRALERDLRERVDGEVRFDPGSRGAYSTDAANYRQVPIGVVVPRTIEAGVAAVTVCREHRAPVVSRGGGTSLAGQTCNVAVVIDWSKYCRRVTSVDPDAKTCIVELTLLPAVRDVPAETLVLAPPTTADYARLGGLALAGTATAAAFTAWRRKRHALKG